MTSHPPIFILNGPTASGKSALALAIAQSNDIVIINCDSKQIFKNIPIITAQPTSQEQTNTQHLLYGYVDEANHASVSDWTNAAITSIKSVQKSGKIPFLVGGTGMYIKSLIHGISPMPDIDSSIRQQVRNRLEAIGNDAFFKELEALDPITTKKLNSGDSQRITRAMEIIKQTGKSLTYWQSIKPIPHFPLDAFELFFLDSGREATYKRCNTRFHSMTNQGLIEEMEVLHTRNLDRSLPAMKAHGVPEMMAYLDSTLSLDEAMQSAIKNTRHYIKRQYTWARNQMRNACWVTPENYTLLTTRVNRAAT